MFLSSHLLAEVAHSADDAIVIHRGRLVSAGPVAELSTARARHRRHDRRRRPARGHPRPARCHGHPHGPDTLSVTGVDRAVVGRAALEVGAVVTDLHAVGDDLESVFADLIHRQEATLMITLLRIELLKLRTTPAVVRRAWPSPSSSPAPRC